MSLLKIHNARLVMPNRIIPNGSVLIKDNVIHAVAEGDVEAETDASFDAAGNYVAPGFIDIHIHGGGGADFMDADADAFLQVARTHARYGTTAMMPTTLSCEPDELVRTIEQYTEADKRNSQGAQFVGLHIEGPYFAMNQRGAQDARFIRKPDPAEYQPLVEKYPAIKRWSAAPELEGALEFATYMKSKGILPALAHTDAVYEEVLKGFEYGFALATHLYSGMSSVTRRNAYRFAGAVESAFLIEDMFVEVIADGCHLPAPLLKLIYKIKGAGKIALITDAMRGAAMPEGESLLGSRKNGMKVIIEDGVAKLPDRSSFAGSVATADRLVRNMIRLADVPVFEAVKMMTSTPAAILGLSDKKGTLARGKDADIIVFDDNINIAATMVNGNFVYQKQFIQPLTQPITHERRANTI